MKIYIIATPCSGKTTFIKKHNGKYKNLTLLDHDDYKSCFSDKLLSLPDNSCMFGRPHIPKYKEIIYLSVVIPMEELEYNLKSRLRCDKNNYWNSMDKILTDSNDGRNTLLDIIKEYNIQSFESFNEALNFIISDNQPK